MNIIPNVADLTIDDIRKGYNEGLFTCTDLVKTYCARIEEVNYICHAVIEVNPDALSAAAACDEAHLNGLAKGSLHGIPVLVKDMFNTNDKMDTTAGSLALKGARFGQEATVIRNLRESGAIILGTTNMTEWANFRSGKAPNGWTPRGGQCHGPYCGSQDPAGSSSGSAVAARLGLAAACIGTENNGSITSPASRAAVVGLKPTVGLTSRYGVWPANYYQDTPGPLTRRVIDAAAMLNVMAGYDDADPYTSSIPGRVRPDYVEHCKADALQGARLAVPRESILDSVKDKEVLEQFETTLGILRSCGTTIVEDTKYSSWTRAWNQQTMPFVYSQLKKSMAVYFQSLEHNPYNIKSLADLVDFIKSEPAERFDLYGTSTFEKALETELNDEDLNLMFSRRFAKGSEIPAMLEMNSCDAMIVPAHCHNPSDLGQLPVICVPMGVYSSKRRVEKTDGGIVSRGPNIPFGLYFVGRKWDEATIIALAYAYEQATAAARERLDQPILTPTAEMRDFLQQPNGADEGAKL